MGNYKLPSALKGKRYYSNSTPDYGKNEDYPSRHHPDHPFSLSPFHHLNFSEPGWRIQSALRSTRAAISDMRAGTPGRGWEGKRTESIKTYPAKSFPMLLWGFILTLPILTSFFVTQFFALCAEPILSSLFYSFTFFLFLSFFPTLNILWRIRF